MVGGRVRKPTARVLDAVESQQLLSSLSHERRRAPAGPAAAAAAAAAHAPASAQAGSGTAAAGAQGRSAPVKRRGKAQNAKGKQAVAREQGLAAATALDSAPDAAAEAVGDDDEEQDMTLYCVCLGYDTGEQPMIQCEHCSNWFHFSCVGLTEGSAAGIEAYTCDMCEQMGMGSTRMIGDAPTHVAPSSTFYDAGDAYQPDAHAEEQDDEDEEKDEAGEEAQDGSDGDFGAAGSGARNKRKPSKVSASRPRTRRKVESAEEESDDDYDEDDQPKKSRAKRPAQAGKRRTSSSQHNEAKPAAEPAATSSVPASDKTRTHVRKQLTSIFSSIFNAAAASGPAAHVSSATDGIDIRSTAFAEEVEIELFEAHAEPDDKGVRGPRTRYASKFRSLHFNLKSNAYLRSRVANNELSAHKLINLSADDLQTPELRAMAESVRAASLRNSVKEVLAAPTAKRTHKGEEEIDNEATRIIEAEQVERVRAAQAEEARKRGEDGPGLDGNDSPMTTAAFPNPMDDSPGPASPAAIPGIATRASYSDSPAGTPRPRSSLVPDETPPPQQQRAGELAGSPAPPPREGGTDMSPPPAPPKPRHSASNFDITSIWGKVKAASPEVGETSQSPAGGEGVAAEEGQGEGADEEEGPDLFRAGSGAEDDDFEDDLFRDGEASPKKKASSKPASVKPVLPAVSELPPVWTGDLLVPEEGGFPSVAVQVGGRPLGAGSGTWKQLLPRALSTAGRLPTDKAIRYLVECSLAPTRELVVTALLPDTTGPTTDSPHKPPKDSCLAKHRHIYDTYLQRDRAGVVQPGREIARLVKDIYIIPLPKDAPTPEYLELADEHSLPDEGARDEDLLLCILVVQKGVLPTVRPTPASASTTTVPVSASAPPPAPAMSAPPPVVQPAYGASPPYTGAQSPVAHQPYAAQPAVAGYASPPPAPLQPSGATAGFDAGAMQSLLSQVNPATIDTLLANPSLLNSIPGFGGAVPPHGGSMPPPASNVPMGYPAGPAPMAGPYGAHSPNGGGYGAPPQPPMQGPGSGYGSSTPLGSGGGGGPPVHPSRQALLGGGGGPPPPAGPRPAGGGPPVHPSRLAMMGQTPPYGQPNPQQGWNARPPPPAGPPYGQGGYPRY